MKVKEAIEKLSNEVVFNEDYGFVNDEVLIELDTLEASQIIGLLKQGEKYRQAYRELKSDFPYLRGELEVKEFFNEFEQEYFPKGGER